MATFFAIYVRACDPATMEALRSEYPTAYTEPGMEFHAIEEPPSGWPPDEDELCDLSKRLATDILWLFFQSVVDAFDYHHWRAGEHLRCLVYGCSGQERTWERAEGQVEAWEWEAIFNRGDLANRVEDAPANEEDKSEYERIASGAALSPGQEVPWLDARETARMVAAYYGLPGWHVKDGP